MNGWMWFEAGTAFGMCIAAAALCVGLLLKRRDQRRANAAPDPWDMSKFPAPRRRFP